MEPAPRQAPVVRPSWRQGPSRLAVGLRTGVRQACDGPAGGSWRSRRSPGPAPPHPTADRSTPPVAPPLARHPQETANSLAAARSNRGHHANERRRSGRDTVSAAAASVALTSFWICCSLTSMVGAAASRTAARIRGVVSWISLSSNSGSRACSRSRSIPRTSSAASGFFGSSMGMRGSVSVAMARKAVTNMDTPVDGATASCTRNATGLLLDEANETEPTFQNATRAVSPAWRH